jgi:hypothetical protein
MPGPFGFSQQDSTRHRQNGARLAGTAPLAQRTSRQRIGNTTTTRTVDSYLKQLTRVTGAARRSPHR